MPSSKWEMGELMQGARLKKAGGGIESDKRTKIMKKNDVASQICRFNLTAVFFFLFYVMAHPVLASNIHTASNNQAVSNL